jgi:hypothetical protein
LITPIYLTGALAILAKRVIMLAPTNPTTIAQRIFIPAKLRGAPCYSIIWNFRGGLIAFRRTGAGVVNLGTNFQLLLYRWARVANYGDQRDYERTSAVNLILPRTCVLARSGIIASWLQASTPPTNIATPRAVTH